MKFPGDPRLNIYSWLDYLRLRDKNHVFSDLLAISSGRHPYGAASANEKVEA